MTNQRGFTLIEMAIVLAIVGLLVGGGLFAVNATLERSRRIQTNATMDQVEASLLLFVIRNNRLPCPADGGIASGTANYGMEQTTVLPNAPQSCSVALNRSVVPWVTLGLDEGLSVDGWNHRFSYVAAGAQGGTGWNSLVDPGLGGIGASATAGVGSNKLISGVTIGSPGSGYVAGTAYTISFAGSGGSASTGTTATPTGTTMTGAAFASLPGGTNFFTTLPNVIFHSAGCLYRTTGTGSLGRSAYCDPTLPGGTTQALDPSYPYGNYIAVYAIAGAAVGTELTTAQPVAQITSANVAQAGGRAAYVLISHGTSGWYAWTKGGGSQILPPVAVPLKAYNGAATAANELAGAANSYGYVQGTPQGSLTTPTGIYFDDIVRWRSPAMIIQLCGSGACGNP